jgi:cobalt-zinc-cadmium efflux system protein
LAIALAITAGIMFLEWIGGLVTNSLALLSDAGHMLSDVAALALSLIAFHIAARPASPEKTYGFYRFEILAALANGAALLAIAGWIVWEAAERLRHPPEVASGTMMAVAFVGLLANLASAWALMAKGDVRHNVNLRSAYLHVIGDALGSAGAILAGLVMLLFDWYAADPLISVFVALLIVRSAWAVVKQSVHILMEGTPAAIDRHAVHRALSGIEGVRDVHDLHIWTITSGFDSLSCHLLVAEGTDCQRVLQEAIRLVEQRFGIRHATIQVETPAIRHEELNC